MNSMPRSSQNNVAQYRKVDVVSGVETASPHKLIQMLLDGALAKVHAARGLMQQHEVAAKGEQIGWAIAIIGSLRGSLDLQAGGSIATNLDALYDYLLRRLLAANLDNDLNALDEVIRLLSEIRAGWNGIRPDQGDVSPAP